MGNIISSGAEISEKKDSHPEREKKENIFWHETSNKDHGKAGEEIAFEEEPEN